MAREDSLIKTQVAGQQEKTKVKEQQAANYRAQINLTKSRAQQTITEIQGNATAKTKLVIAEARGQ